MIKVSLIKLKIEYLMFEVSFALLTTLIHLKNKLQT